MALNDVIFKKGNGGLGRSLGAEDYISALAIYDEKFLDNASFIANGIATFTATNRIVEINRLEDIEDLGIKETNSLMKEYWYQIKEYFRLNSNGKLFVGLFNDTTKDLVPAALTFNEIYTMQVFALGVIRQMGIMNVKNAFATASVELIQGVCALCEERHFPLSTVYGADFSAVVDITTIGSLKTLSTVSPNVSVVILQDGGNVGNALFVSEGNSVPAVGATLGAISSSVVNQSIAEVGVFNLSEGGELEVVAFANGELFTDLDLPNSTDLSDLNAKGYIFGVKHIGIAGTYFNDNHTADVITSDYYSISQVRTIDKAIRQLRTRILPYLNSRVKVNKAGQLDSSTINFYTSVCNNELDKMITAGEIVAASVYINPAQNILTTGKLMVTLVLLPYGIAKEIEITIGYTVSL